jgi:hypothetical protein
MRAALLCLLAVYAGLAQHGPLMQSILPRLETNKLNIVESAEAMPESDYKYKLTPAQRSFADWIAHTIQMNYGSCSGIHTQPAPDAKHFNENMPKDRLVAGIKDSFAYCEAAFKSMSDESALQPIEKNGRKIIPVNVMVGLIHSWAGHYGNMVGYLRTKNIIPPSTARAQRSHKH